MRSLQLNDNENNQPVISQLGGHPYRTLAVHPHEKIDYVLFDGSNTEQMPLLVAEGFVPASAAQIMQRRVDVLNSNVPQEVKDSWWKKYFDTGDAPAYDSQGNMKVVLDAQPLLELTSKSKLHNGALVLPQGTYAGLQGEEFSKEQLVQYAGKCLNKGQSVDNPVWVALARGDKTLLSEYDTAAFARAKEFGYDTAMGIFVVSPREKENMRLWVVGDVGYSLACVYSDYDLDCCDGCLVGVAPEARVLASKYRAKRTLLDRILGR
ncbi:hypothetical protein HZB03_04305 [Candidatus Woesearchaeota archaeon]|nr:hypothetical protein [Candidatus Woesearchaeota archaeon]